MLGKMVDHDRRLLLGAGLACSIALAGASHGQAHAQVSRTDDGFQMYDDEIGDYQWDVEEGYRWEDWDDPMSWSAVDEGVDYEYEWWERGLYDYDGYHDGYYGTYYEEDFGYDRYNLPQVDQRQGAAGSTPVPRDARSAGDMQQRRAEGKRSGWQSQRRDDDFDRWLEQSSSPPGTADRRQAQPQRRGQGQAQSTRQLNGWLQSEQSPTQLRTEERAARELEQWISQDQPQDQQRQQNRQGQDSPRRPGRQDAAQQAPDQQRSQRANQEFDQWLQQEDQQRAREGRAGQDRQDGLRSLDQWLEQDQQREQQASQQGEQEPQRAAGDEFDRWLQQDQRQQPSARDQQQQRDREQRQQDQQRRQAEEQRQQQPQRRAGEGDQQAVPRTLEGVVTSISSRTIQSDEYNVFRVNFQDGRSRLVAVQANQSLDNFDLQPGHTAVFEGRHESISGINVFVVEDIKVRRRGGQE